MTRDALSAEEILRKVHSIGDYYGFIPFASLAARHKGSGRPSHSSEMPLLPPLDPTAESIAVFLKQCVDAGLMPSPRQPLFVWHSNITPGRNAPRVAQIQFHAIGTDRALADAVVIHAMRALARDLMKSDYVIRINTLGDKETRARFARELGNFFKKNSAILPEECLTCARRDVFEAAELAIERRFAEHLPAPTDFLSDQSRKRFEELLDYLEATETPYELAPDLLSRSGGWGEACFALTHEDKTLVWGSRYGELARLFFKSAMPAVGAVLKTETEGAKVFPVKRRARLRFAFVHIGDEAKHASIKLAEELRKARLPIWQIIGLESLTEQMYHVERLNPPYLIVMGRKEALEHSVVLRNRATQEDVAIPIEHLTERLRSVA
ncbi:hypothetical protein A3H77_02295 [Candidatus Kaiserbacteria bacterium RIFCSPLOWO2_02_FULL_56_11]|uniref:Anticodon-binding domain-containing protein n=2 Tax=Candidatus Kaiseribacteriota TaxID=1752734 RepID=A0A1F6E4K5_9BACT|nr:MAG: hypothetical protein A3C95_00295 [Candidatus Kaiserbacteria bacterium RIFCSPHIGHO2_02_FULL_56_30]OGG71713.1 MAG: hypothetical protein A3E65_01075 [Candidatus Kaiserbacteria bacterium RIFCSPHIGHO2_12_FULL_56_13]OGG81232.1 MAG: hypothetical protein A3H77_02295 [Candidatus Kaiserbacteria bacterium RIFCSPLOWO2_02_FULL_56_11]